MIFQFSKKWLDDNFFSMEYHVYRLLKSSCFEIFRDGKYGLFSSQNFDGKMVILLISENFLLWIFQRYGLFLSQKIVGKMIFTDYWKVLVLNFSVMGSTVFFSVKKLMGKMIFTWFLWAFHDIPRLGKYGFFAVLFTSY